MFHTKCSICACFKVEKKLTFPPSPISNRFLAQSEVNPEVTISLGVCDNCDTAQLIGYPDPETVKSIHSWLHYNEPEGHLDTLLEEFTNTYLLDKGSHILATTYKDKSTIERFKARGYLNCANLDYSSLKKPYGLETIQNYLTSTNLDTISHNKKFDCIVARHLVEHANDAKKLLEQLVSLLKSNGILLIELPESSKIFNTNNHAFIWEEHISYLRFHNIETIASSINCCILNSWQFDYPYEDSLVIALSPLQNKQETNKLTPHKKIDITHFCESFEVTSQFWQKKLRKYKANNKKVALFGAGHLAIRFIKFYQLEELISIVIDDNKNKVGTYIPSTNIKIVSSMSISAAEYPICLSTLSPESELKVKKTNSYFSSNVEIINCFIES